ncbi:MAG: hypothetical protein DYG89_54690 [Caldilinea sp. CFX5]|nr:hypothetical protein [Caldilinea sp. CFX5]
MWPQITNPLFIHAQVVERQKELLHQAAMHHLLNEIQPDHPTIIEHLLDGTGDLLITLGGWLKGR